MKCFTLFTLFLGGCTALLPFSPGTPPDLNHLQTVDAGPETPVSPDAGEKLVDASPRYVAAYPLPRCCPSKRFWSPIRCRHCAHTNTALPTPAHVSTLPWFDNFTVPVPTGHHTRVNHTTQALNTTISTVSTTSISTVTPTVTNHFRTNNEHKNAHPTCTIADGKIVNLYKCIPRQHHQTNLPTPTTLATLATPSASPPSKPHWRPHHAPCTTTLTTTPTLNLAPETAAGTTVTDTKYVNCHGCKLEIKTEDRFGHGPMVSSAFVTVPRGAASATATETVTRCYPVQIIA